MKIIKFASEIITNNSSSAVIETEGLITARLAPTDPKDLEILNEFGFSLNRGEFIKNDPQTNHKLEPSYMVLFKTQRKRYTVKYTSKQQAEKDMQAFIDNPKNKDPFTALKDKVGLISTMYQQTPERKDEPLGQEPSYYWAEVKKFMGETF